MTAAIPNFLVMKAVFGCLLVTVVVTMAIVDCREMILPNGLNLLLAGIGLSQAVLLGQPSLINGLLGAMLGFMVLRTVAALFRHLRGIDGLGFGDQKFAAAAGLWIGWEGIAPMLLMASCSALAFVAIRAANNRKLDPKERISFGPFLGFGVMICWSTTVAYGA